MATLPRRGPTIYHQGWLNVRTTNPSYQRYFVQLKCNEIVLFHNEPKTGPAATQHAGKKFPLNNIERIDMDQSERVSSASTFSTISLVYSVSPEYNIKEVRMRATKKSEQDDWFRHLWVVIKRDIPETWMLLPGQVQKLQDVIEKVSLETDYLHPCDLPTSPPPRAPFDRRISSSAVLTPFGPTSPGAEIARILRKNPGTIAEQPKWFYSKRLDRINAEDILRKNQDHGNMLMRVRDAQDEWTYAVSVKVSAGDSEFKHYRVKQGSATNKQEFVIFLGEKNHPKLLSKQDVMDYFIAESEGKFVPLRDRRPDKNPVYDIVPAIGASDDERNGNTPRYVNDAGAFHPARTDLRNYLDHQISCPNFHYQLPEEPDYTS